MTIIIIKIKIIIIIIYLKFSEHSQETFTVESF